VQAIVPPAWYPDPARTHELRYFDTAWTDHVSDGGRVSQHPLGPVPPGLTGWFPPDIMVRSAMSGARPLEIPRVKMWVLAVFSLFMFSVNSFTIPVGVFFAIWCWTTTTPAFRSHRSVGSPAVTEIRAARWVAVVLAAIALVQFVLELFNVGGSLIVWHR
jgi:uncharacterized protein DUF2510